MQATVARLDPDRSGSVILDNGHLLPFSTAVFLHSGLRTLRPGQRVRIRVAAGEVTALTLSTFALPSPVDVADDKEH
ncbi:hypothetical protein [Fodinicola feengrottensis]|uniref:Cold-shock protein n=1 Tax=Fodinicola feengrottensis TaxID=435914 RepID=A0ABP4S3L3_9ACTN|nr:hypothetical protein [Fodinicola feengrottensis]